MNQVGELIQKSIEAMDGGESEAAFAAACAALKKTLTKSLETDVLTKGDYYNFVRVHWKMFSFMGLPRALPIPLNVDYKMKTLVPGFNLSGGEELVLHLVQQTGVMERTPPQFKFHPGTAVEIRGNQIYVPQSLIGALLGVVIVQPVNKGETVPDKYWINIFDFKMFISEFWGRMDLAERIMSLYLD